MRFEPKVSSATSVWRYRVKEIGEEFGAEALVCFAAVHMALVITANFVGNIFNSNE